MKKTDFYLSYKNFYMRLKDDYQTHGKLIIAYDFDDTVSNFSALKYKDARGYENTKILKLLQQYRDYGYFILFTARSSEKDLEEAISYIKEKNIPLDAVNENMPNLPFNLKINAPSKIYYNVFLDDKAGLKWPYKALKKLLRYIKKENKHDCKAR